MTDQYFTNETTSLECWETLQDFLKLQFPQTRDICYIEPSAGLGNLFYLLPKSKRIGYEMDKNLCKLHPEYKCANFLKIQLIPCSKSSLKVFFGNPPFSNVNGTNKNIGRKINLQAAFINKCYDLDADVVAFIVGASMQRLKPGAPVVPNMTIKYSQFLPQCEFRTMDNKLKYYNTYFNIYIREKPASLLGFNDTVNLPRPWILTDPSSSARVDEIVHRWGSRVGFSIKCDSSPNVNSTQLIKNIKSVEFEKTQRYNHKRYMPTSSRFFFIQFKNPKKTNWKQWCKFVDLLKEYVYTVSTVTSSSLGIYEMYTLWDRFTNSK